MLIDILRFRESKFQLLTLSTGLRRPHLQNLNRLQHYQIGQILIHGPSAYNFWILFLPHEVWVCVCTPKNFYLEDKFSTDKPFCPSYNGLQTVCVLHVWYNHGRRSDVLYDRTSTLIGVCAQAGVPTSHQPWVWKA